MLYTSDLSVFKSKETKLKPYYVIENHGNDAIVPEQVDLNQYLSGEITWNGFKVNYQAKLMKPEAEEWMKRVSNEAVNEDVVLVSDEESVERGYRILLAERMVNMFSGQGNLRYNGELSNPQG